MHEASIATHLIQAVERRIDEGEITGRVRSIFLRVGRMTAVVPDNLRFLFGVLAEGSAVEGAELEIEEVPIRGRCRACEAEFEIHDICFFCSQCGSSDVDITSGRELMIVAVEVD
jgi:hydrogenase nickel incorporation protein HypA/HybF